MIHEHRQHVQISLSAFLWRRFTVCACIIGASFAYGGEAAGQGRGVSPHGPQMGLSFRAYQSPRRRRSLAGGAKQGLSPSSPFYPTPVTPPFPDFTNILACLCTIVRHKGRNLWHNKKLEYSGLVPATAPVPACAEDAIWIWI